MSIKERLAKGVAEEQRSHKLKARKIFACAAATLLLSVVAFLIPQSSRFVDGLSGVIHENNALRPSASELSRAEQVCFEKSKDISGAKLISSGSKKFILKASMSRLEEDGYVSLVGELSKTMADCGALNAIKSMCVGIACSKDGDVVATISFN
ncbi:hypothetical protein V6259_12550 [Marinomonas sp. TI.3.20]|uniref:hypothetical protein n=1 Tax=Marinomonas sp. TI.3.20 TaxID=3121296 RepID=UPI00311DEE4B